MQLCDHGVLLYPLQWGSKSKTIFGFHSSICTQNVSLLDDNLNKSGLKESYGWFYLNVNGKLEDSSFGRYLGEIASATYFFRFWVFLVKLMLCMPPIHRAPLCFHWFHMIHAQLAFLFHFLVINLQLLVPVKVVIVIFDNHFIHSNL